MDHWVPESDNLFNTQWPVLINYEVTFVLTNHNYFLFFLIERDSYLISTSLNECLLGQMDPDDELHTVAVASVLDEDVSARPVAARRTACAFALLCFWVFGAVPLLDLGPADLLVVGNPTSSG